MDDIEVREAHTLPQSWELTQVQERLRSHAQAFDGLLSLIPAKYYYGDDNSVCATPSIPVPSPS